MVWVLYSGCITPARNDPVPNIKEAGWAAGPVWTSAENLASTGIRSPHRPARSESLYRLRHPGPTLNWRSVINFQAPAFVTPSEEAPLSTG
jgi:hypothetical protein